LQVFILQKHLATISISIACASIQFVLLIWCIKLYGGDVPSSTLENVEIYFIRFRFSFTVHWNNYFKVDWLVKGPLHL